MKRLCWPECKISWLENGLLHSNKRNATLQVPLSWLLPWAVCQTTLPTAWLRLLRPSPMRTISDENGKVDPSMRFLLRFCLLLPTAGHFINPSIYKMAFQDTEGNFGSSLDLKPSNAPSSVFLVCFLSGRMFK